MKLKINLQNCYGIRALNAELDFGNKHAFSIYASNGTMKTSLAKTFLDLREGKKSKDAIHEERKTIREITIGEGPLLKQNCFVVKPYEEQYKSGKIARLLVNEKLKKKYDDLYDEIERQKNNFLTNVINLSGHKSNGLAEKEISKVLQQGNEKKFFDALQSVRYAIKKMEETEYEAIKYRTVFDENTEKLFSRPEFIKNIQKYVQKYNQLLEESNFFKKGIFNHTQAEAVAKNLKKQGFFEAKHYITLINKKTEGDTVIETEPELIKVIEDEKALILENQELKKLFQLVDENMRGNQASRDFREYLSNNQQVISQLSNPEEFKATLWKEYFKAHETEYNKLLEMHDDIEAEVKKIREAARKERADWDNVIEDFNQRFIVPFKVEVDNKIDTMLSEEPPLIVYRYTEGIEINDGIEIDESKLKSLLSQGERRALYILNILFEIEARKKSDEMCILIIDDVADSFDYQNKYAIIEYLRELSNHRKFYLIILTHNFDFHRTVCSRLDMERQHKLLASKFDDRIELKSERYQFNPINHWRNNLDKPNMQIAAIPMIRNLFEYSGSEDECNSMASYLHIKSDTKTLSLQNITEKMHKILPLKCVDKIKNTNTNYYELLMKQCDSLSQQDELELEEKIVLSIGIRLNAEEYMIKKINDNDFVNGIKKDQTFKLLKKYKDECSDDTDNKKKLERVNLMTPENIHLNSFMYEPLIDMGSKQLIDLYNDIHRLLSQSD